MYPESVGMFFFSSPALPPQELNKPLPAISVSMYRDATPITSSREFKDGVDAIVARTKNERNKYICIEKYGAAWRGKPDTIFSDPIRFRMMIPKDIPKGTSRYLYIGVEQPIVNRVVEVRSDIGVVYDASVGRAVPFVTTEDPSLHVSDAQVLVWDLKHPEITVTKNHFTNFKNKYYTVTPHSPLFPAASFAPGDHITLSLQAVPDKQNKSLLILTMKSDDKTVIVRIPRSNTLLSTHDGLKVHKVTSTTVNAAHRKSFTASDLLICSTTGLSKTELMSFPPLGNLFLRTQMAKR